MRLIKLKINRTRKEGATHYEYPSSYVAEKVVFGPIYEGGLKEVVQSDILPRNADDEFILIGVKDIDFDEFMKANGYERDGFIFTAEEVNRDQAVEMGHKWTRQVEKMVDEEKVLGIIAKSVRGEILTQKEKDAIDPEKEESGINKTAKFEEGLDKFLAL